MKLILTFLVVGIVGIGFVSFAQNASAVYEESVQKKIDECLQKKNPEYKADCLRRLAVEERDETICELIEKVPERPGLWPSGYDLRDKCYRYILMIEDVIPDGHLLCEKIKDKNTKNSCYIHFIIKNKNPSECERFQDPATKDGCYFDYGERTGDTFACSKIIKEGKDLCYYRAILFHGGKTSVCNEINNYTLRQGCKMHSDFTLNSFWIIRLLIGMVSLLIYIGIAFGLFRLLRSGKFTHFYSENSGRFISILTTSAIGAIYYIGFMTLLAILGYSFGEKLSFLQYTLLLPLWLVPFGPVITWEFFGYLDPEHVLPTLFEAHWFLWVWLPAFVYGGLITNIFLVKKSKTRKKLIIILIIVCILSVGFNFLLMVMGG